MLPLLGLLVAGAPAFADETGLTEEFLQDPANIALGQQLFRQQCVKCHGTGAYPGKAPKLKVKKLAPEDIYLRVTYGYGKMPAWENVFTEDERMAITAYMKSPHFSTSGGNRVGVSSMTRRRRVRGGGMRRLITLAVGLLCLASGYAVAQNDADPTRSSASPTATPRTAPRCISATAAAAMATTAAAAPTPSCRTSRILPRRTISSSFRTVTCLQ